MLEFGWKFAIFIIEILQPVSLPRLCSPNQLELKDMGNLLFQYISTQIYI